MNGRHELSRKGISAVVAILMLTLSIALPVLEHSDILDEPVAESEHNPATCPSGHDHTICTQVGVNMALPAESPAYAPGLHEATVGAPGEQPTVLSAAFPEGHPSRAPPLA